MKSIAVTIDVLVATQKHIEESISSEVQYLNNQNVASFEIEEAMNVIIHAGRALQNLKKDRVTLQRAHVICSQRNFGRDSM